MRGDGTICERASNTSAEERVTCKAVNLGTRHITVHAVKLYRPIDLDDVARSTWFGYVRVELRISVQQHSWLRLKVLLLQPHLEILGAPRIGIVRLREPRHCVKIA